MDTTDKSLFQIGEVTKSLGITRRMLINYEDLGLVTPAIKNEGRGYRYYTADNIIHIKLIRSLQHLGLSLSEIRNYFDNTTHLNEQIDRLVLLRNELDQYIAQLRLRQSAGKDADIRQVTLPAFTAFCREFKNKDIATKTAEIRQAYIDAAKNHQLDSANRMSIHVSIDSMNIGEYIVPVVQQKAGKNIKDFPQVEAICIYYRGPYEGFPEIHNRLLQYAHEHKMTPNGYFRNIYMEGPPTHGANKNAYITQIALPIKFVTIDDKE